MINKLNRCPDYKGTATNYPLSTELKRAVPEFLYPWLYKSNLFYLEVAFNKNGEAGQYELTTNYSIICLNDSNVDCETTEVNVQPMFVVTVYDIDENILHSTFVHHADQFKVQKQPMDFNPETHPLFVVNMRYHGNFIVKYPESVYNAFISKLLSLEKEGKNDTDRFFSTDKRLSFFALDMLDLSLINKIKMTYVFKLLSIAHAWHNIMQKALFSPFDNFFNARLNMFKDCLSGYFLSYVQENDPNIENSEIVRKFRCRLDNKSDDCQYDKVNISKIDSWGVKICADWTQKWKGKMQVYLKDFNQQEGFED
ncbi:uncharacterized protein LOC142351943 [Convolutriloba macropyga]|uniref:uncharacterized protein LOC142351943 n=1 Tax=Convolutriloba macropyga TaxID=536237 RepID=UPI003F51D840